jgi:hypothetical protein
MSYQFDHDWHKERERRAALEATFDPLSRKPILGSQIIPGWSVSRLAVVAVP